MRRLKIKETIARAAMMLLMLLTTASAWAFKTETPVTYTVSYISYNHQITIGGGTNTSWTASSIGVDYYATIIELNNNLEIVRIHQDYDVAQ